VLVGKRYILPLMENKGQLIAMDLYETKQLKIRAKRDGAFNIEYRIIQPSN
jgi:16S rRNA (cytosine967-C5)-methyltransferase